MQWQQLQRVCRRTDGCWGAAGTRASGAASCPAPHGSTKVILSPAVLGICQLGAASASHACNCGRDAEQNLMAAAMPCLLACVPAAPAVTPDTPVWFMRHDAHMGFANSAALQLAGVSAATPDPPGGTILRGADGEPTGLLTDSAMQLVAGAGHGLAETLASAAAVVYCTTPACLTA